ncbi:DUF1674 domain-containing protein [Pedomonas mirosovicensis]|uniref:DUF1674 domain-containing protein n=1 Tax=Pedomonas mirosovicensis TaxID=2908641 RepID=UPI0021671303|nr:DUF1674 domain-containing protein [Pedomonas mirosovicensis]MCH8684148.1 DUF1674 domain-containing protein [Pedomonas mirosovicensis]
MTDKPREQEAEKTGQEPGQAGETQPPQLPKEIGGRKGPEPTRYGDWEKGGICSDF